MTAERSNPSRDRLLVVTRHYAPEPIGSAPPMQQLAEWFAAEGDSVEVVTVRPSYPAAEITPGYAKGEHDRAIEAGVQVRRFPTRAVSGQGLLQRLLPETAFMIRLWAARASGALAPSAHVVSLCPSILTVIGALPLVQRGGRHVVIVHDIQSGLGTALGSGITRYIMPLLRWIESWGLNRADAIVVLSEAMARQLRALGVRKPIMIQPPMVDARSIQPLERPSGSPPTLLYSGNLGRKQGLGQVLDLAAVMWSRAPGVRIVVRGEGAMRTSLVEEAKARGLANLVFEDLAPRSEIARAMSEGDVHLVPQISSGGDFAVPSKIFSIMAAGRPFVATAEPDSPLAHLASGCGAFLCVPPDAPDRFADAVQMLLDEPERRAWMGQAGRDYVERNVDTPIVMQEFKRLLMNA